LSRPFVWAVRVYWEDTDAGGVVYYANYLRFLERARSEWLRSIGLDQAALMRDAQRQFAIIEVHAHYRKPARYDDALVVTAELTEARPASFAFRQEIRRGDLQGELLLEATVRDACLDSVTLKPARLPRDLAARLAAGVVASEGDAA